MILIFMFLLFLSLQSYSTSCVYPHSNVGNLIYLQTQILANFFFSYLAYLAASVCTGTFSASSNTNSVATDYCAV
jgi:hypothetical protein